MSKIELRAAAGPTNAAADFGSHHRTTGNRGGVYGGDFGPYSLRFEEETSI